MLADTVFMTSATTGTGTYDLDPFTGDNAGLFQTFVEGIGNGNLAEYRVVMGEEWEKGYGLVTAGSPDTLTRVEITGSSNGGAAVNWGPGVKSVYCFPSADSIRFGAVGSLPSATGTGNAQEIAHNPPHGALRPGNVFRWLVATANSGAATLDVDGLGGQAIRKTGGAALTGGELVVGRVAMVIWDGVIFRLLTPPVTAYGETLGMAADAAAARTTLAAPAAPNSSGGVGTWSAQNGGDGNAVGLPSGGTWAWFALIRIYATGGVTGVTYGVDAGGTTVAAPGAGSAASVVHWRIA